MYKWWKVDRPGPIQKINFFRKSSFFCLQKNSYTCPKKKKFLYFVSKTIFLNVFYTVHITTYSDAFFSFYNIFQIFNQPFHIVHTHTVFLFCNILSTKRKKFLSKKFFLLPKNFLCLPEKM